MIAALLELPPEAPILHVEPITYLLDAPLEYCDVWLTGEKLRATSILRRH